MKVLVVGATGRTGRHIVTRAVEAGHEVRAFSRSIQQAGLPEGAEAWRGDVCDSADVDAAIAGMDAVIVALSMVRTSDNPWARITTPLDLHTQAASVLLPACEAAGVRRYLTISAHGVGPSRPRAGWGFLALVHSSNIGVAYNNLADAEVQIANSALDWTVVRPTRLTNTPATGQWTADAELVTTSLSRIPRDDVAAFLVGQLTDRRWSRQAVSVTGS